MMPSINHSRSTTPDAIAEVNTEGLANPDKVILHQVNRHRSGVDLNLLTEAISRPRKAAHQHPHRAVLPLDLAGRDVGNGSTI